MKAPAKEPGHFSVCEVCGKPAYNPGQLLPLCSDCDQKWLASPERGEAGTARQRFIDRARNETVKA